MLVRFKFNNFKCFRDEAVLSMWLLNIRAITRWTIHLRRIITPCWNRLLFMVLMQVARPNYSKHLILCVMWFCRQTNSRTVGRRSMLLLNCQRCQQKSQAYLRLSSFWRGCNIDMACRNAEDANEIMWYATQARDAYALLTALSYIRGWGHDGWMTTTLCRLMPWRMV